MPAVILYFTEQRPRQKPENAHFRAKETDKERRATPKFLSATRGDRKQYLSVAKTVRCKHPADAAMAGLIFCYLHPKEAPRRKAQGRKTRSRDARRLAKKERRIQIDAKQAKPRTAHLG